MAIDIRTFSPLEFVALGPILFALWSRGRTPGYLLCLTAFFLYVWAALEETIFPLRVDAGYVDMMRQGRSWNGFVNLVPFAFGSDVQSVQIYGNVLLGVPMGFGLPFVISARLRRVVVAGLILGGGIELLQLVIGLIYGFPYRVVDINDALLNFAGVMAGYAALKMCARVYRRLVGTAETSDALFGHINTVLLSA